MPKKSHTIAFRLTGDEYAALDEMRKPDQRMSDLVREIIKERNNDQPTTSSGPSNP